MKPKIILALLTAVLSLGGIATQAQTTNRPAAMSPELQSVVQSIQTKLKSGLKTEADLATEIKTLDQLLANHAGEKTDEMAQVLYMKAMLYLQVFKDSAKGKELVVQLKQEYPDTKLGKNADRILESLEKAAKAQEIQSALKAGQPFPDFAEKDLDGKPLSVGGLKGKVVLVDFWATWCGPCRAELPNVIAAYKEYHAQGFEIIGVSLDSDREKLDAFLKQQDGMTWAQYFDGEGWQNKLAGKYGVMSIPFTILVGPDGKIIGTNLRGEKLGAAVAAALGK